MAAEHEVAPEEASPCRDTTRAHDTSACDGNGSTLAVASLGPSGDSHGGASWEWRWVGTWSASPQAVASPVQTAIASDRHDDGHREQWVGTWGNALHQPDLGVPGLANSGFNNQTLRQIVHVSVGGPRVRVRLSTFGASGVVIGAAHIALSATGIDSTRVRQDVDLRRRLHPSPSHPARS